MELGLSLGDASNFMEKSKASGRNQNPAEKVGLDFCMSLGLNSGNQEREIKSLEEEDDENDDVEDDDAGDGSDGNNPLQLNLLPLVPVPRQISSMPWSSDNGSSDNGSSGLPAAKGLDVNRTPAAEEVSSANSVGSQSHFCRVYGNGNLQMVGTKRDFDATGNDAVEAERASSRASDDDENGANARKKLRLSKEQSAFLEESFKEHSTLNPKQKLALAKHLNLRPRQVEVWFQNRRARTKLKQTEVDCEYLKRCCETLTEENRRLHKELQELRTLKASNPFYMQLPATTLTMCPSCERVATAAPAAVTVASSAAAATKTTTAVDSIPKAIPFPLTRPRFYPFSQSPAHPNQPAAS